MNREELVVRVRGDIEERDLGVSIGFCTRPKTAERLCCVGLKDTARGWRRSRLASRTCGSKP